MIFVGRELYLSYVQEKRKLQRSGAQPKASKLEGFQHALKRVANNENNLTVRPVIRYQWLQVKLFTNLINYWFEYFDPFFFFFDNQDK